MRSLAEMTSVWRCSMLQHGIETQLDVELTQQARRGRQTAHRAPPPGRRPDPGSRACSRSGSTARTDSAAAPASTAAARSLFTVRLSAIVSTASVFVSVTGSRRACRYGSLCTTCSRRRRSPFSTAVTLSAPGTNDLEHLGLHDDGIQVGFGRIFNLRIALHGHQAASADVAARRSPTGAASCGDPPRRAS